MATVVGAFAAPEERRVIVDLETALGQRRMEVAPARRGGSGHLRARGGPAASLTVAPIETLAACG
eukprot:2459930-Pyramimonas_sp.AAC.1